MKRLAQSTLKPLLTPLLKPLLKPLLLVSLMAGSGFPAWAQTPPATPAATAAPTAHQGMAHRDPAKMEEMRAKHQAALREKLKLTASQEGAWGAFTRAMAPPADRSKTREARHAEMQTLSTPARIERVKSLRAQRDADDDKRANAVKTFYAALTPEQQKVFDAEPLPGRHGHHGGRQGNPPLAKP